MLTKAKLSDLNEIDDLAVLVISDMEKSGIPQWKLNYPRYEHFIKDVEQDGLILYKENKKIIGNSKHTAMPYRTASIVIGSIYVRPSFAKV